MCICIVFVTPTGPLGDCAQAFFLYVFSFFKYVHNVEIYSRESLDRAGVFLNWCGTCTISHEKFTVVLSDRRYRYRYSLLGELSMGLYGAGV